jgi:hypothetical protein
MIRIAETERDRLHYVKLVVYCVSPPKIELRMSPSHGSVELTARVDARAHATFTRKAMQRGVGQKIA